MFTKNLLKIVSALFVGSQLITSVYATVDFTCTTATLTVATKCSNGETVDSYCIDNKIIYAYSNNANGGGKCVVSTNTDTGILAFEDTTSTIIPVTLGTGGSVIDAKNLILYQCTLNDEGEVNCEQTYGYIKVDDDKFCIVSNKQVSDNACKTKSELSAVNCNTLGGLCANAKVHIAAGTDLDFGESNEGYLVNDASTVFVTAGENAIIKSSENAFTKVIVTSGSEYLVNNGGVLTVVKHDLTATDAGDEGHDEKDYCYDNITCALTSRYTSKYNYCDPTNGCDKYYTYDSVNTEWKETTTTYDKRENPVCHPLSNPTKCNDGEFFIVNDEETGVLTTIGSGKLYKCTIGAGGIVGCEEDTTTVGYLKNSDRTTTNTDKIPYIQCSSDIASVPDTRKRNHNELVNKCIALTEMSLAQSNSCSTEGFIKDGGDYKYCSGNLASPSSALVGVTAANFIGSTCVGAEAGTFINGNEICTDEDDGNVLTLGTDNGNHLLDASTTSTFVKVVGGTNYNVIITLDNDNAILKPTGNKKYVYALSKQVFEKGENQSNMCNMGALKENVAEYILNMNEDDVVEYFKENSNE